MANNITNITLPDGTSLTVPAWATETTLQAMMMISQRAGVLSKGMLKGIKAQDQNDKDILEAIEKSFQGIEVNTETNEEEVKGKAGFVLKAATAIKDSATFFGDSEKPLTSLVRSTKSLVNGLEGPNGKGGLAKLGAKFPGLGDFMTGFGGQAVGVASDIVLALAGWNAAKFEQFAEVQKKMIDSGAIMYATGDVFDQLYKDSFQAGITYNAFSDVVANFGGTMTAIGGDVSMGGVRFLKMFKRMSESTDALGDLGMLNTELLNTYAGYIETQRLTGAIDNQLANNGAGLEESFKALVVESTAMANLTSLNRGDIMQRQYAAMSDTMLAAGTQKLRDKGFEKTAALAENLMRQHSIYKDEGPAAGLMEEFAQSFNKAILEFSGDISKFNVELNLDNATRGMFNKIMPGFLAEINTMVQNGEEGNELARNFMLKEFSKMDMTKLGTAGSAQGSTLDLIQQMQASGMLIQKNFGEWEKIKFDNMDKVIKRTEKTLEASGATTVAMNDMAKMFLTAQEFITLPMNKFGTILKSLTTFIEEKTTNAQEIVNNLYESILGSDDTKNTIAKAENRSSPLTYHQDDNFAATQNAVIDAQPTVKKKTLVDYNNDLTNLKNQRTMYNDAKNNGSPRNLDHLRVTQLNTSIKALEEKIELIKRQNAALVIDQINKENLANDVKKERDTNYH